MPQARSTRSTGGQLTIKPHRIVRLLGAVAGGNYIKTSCAYAGVPFTTYRNWVNHGEQEIERVRALGHDPEDILAVFFDRFPRMRYNSADPQWQALVKAKPPAPFYATKWWCVVLVALLEKAEAAAELEAVANVKLAGQNSWQASMTYLERKYPDRWGRRDPHRIEVTGAGGGPVQVEQGVSVEALESALLALAAKQQRMQARAVQPLEVEP